MPVKYIRPNNLITDRKTTKLIKQKKFISEDEYEMNISIIQELLDELNKKENEIENTLNVDYDTFETFRDNIRKNISEISRYIDNSLHNNNYNAEKTVIDLNKIIDNKYKDIKNLYDKLNIEESIINNNFLKNIYIEYIEYNKKKKDYFEINKKIDFTDDLTLKINNNEKIEVKNINKNDIYIIYDEYANIESKMTNVCLKLYLENFCNAKSINEYKILSDIKFNYDINMTNDNGKEPIFLKLNLNNPCVSIKKRCTSISFCYNSVSSGSYGYLYIDGEFKNRYHGSWLEESITDLTDEEHEITFVSINDFILYCIKINNELIFPNDFNNTGTLQLGRDGSGHYYNSTNKTVPFYAINGEIRCVSIKKKCTSMSFYYNTYNGYVYLYIDGVYKNQYTSTSWKKESITDLIDEEHEFTWILFVSDSGRYSCIDTISFNDELVTDKNVFNNKYKIILENISPITMIETNDKTSTPFYINGNTKIKYVSIKKKCTSMSFYYNTYNGYVYLYIDGVYKNQYTSTSWRKESITDLIDEEHEFTWVLVNNNDIDNTYSYIDTISFNNELITDVNEFNNNHMPILINNFIFYKNGNKTTTPFYSIGNFEYVSIKKKRTLVNFYYKTSGGYVYLYIDGVYKGEYSSSSWKQVSITDLTDEEHEFVWILVVDTTNGYSCIDTISFNDELVTDINEFNNEYKTSLIADIPIEDKYKNSNNTSTPFYNNKLGIKYVSIKKKCTSMNFYYKTCACEYVYLYIDGVYKNRYASTSWRNDSITDLTDEEHEFTWILIVNTNSSSNEHYSCIDTISFNDELVTDINEFNNKYKIPLADIPNKNSYYRNGDKTTTPFYIIGTHKFKCVSIKKKCSFVSFYYNTNNGYIYLYIDGIYKGSYYSSSSWKQVSITDLTDEEHEFTWILQSKTSNNNDSYSCIDTIAFNGELITNINEFNNENEIPLADIPTEDNYKHGEDTTTPFYTADGKIKCVSIKKKCMIMSFYYKTNNGYIYLYIDGAYRSKYSSSSWSQASVTDLINKEHEFTLILPKYSCIDTIAFNDELITDINEFNNEYNNQIANILTENNHINNDNIFTPFYSVGDIKYISIKKKCTSMSFYYMTFNNGYVYLYIDGIYRNKYSSSASLTQVSITDLTDEEHEFTWVLYATTINGLSYINTINFNNDINVFENVIMSNNDFLNIISHAIENKKMEIENTIYYNTLYYIKGINKIFKNLIDLSNEKNKYVIKHDNDIFIYNDFYSFINKIYYFDYCFIYVYNEERTKENRIFMIDLNNNNDENLEKINVNIEDSKDKFLRIVNKSNEIEIYKNIKYMK